MDFSGIRSNNVVDPQHLIRRGARAVAAKRLTLKEYEGIYAPVLTISK
jgi:hypothetical protein